MKKLFTLLVGVMLAGSAFGQEKWKTIFNQDLENGFDDQNMEFFECSERHGANRGPVRIVEDPDDPTNHCIKVIVRSDAEAQEEGDRQTEGGWGGQPVHLISWDTQFFIYFKEVIPAGKQIRITMNVKGEKDGSFQFQTHAYPQAYINSSLFPNADNGGNTLSYTTKWAEKPYKKQDVVSESAAKNSSGLEFQCIALNMTHSPYEGNVVYLDNIKVDIRDVPKDDKPMINFMRMGVLSHDPITEVNYGSDSIPDMVPVSNFMIQVRDPERNANILTKAPVVETGDAQFPLAVKVPTLNHKVVQEAIPDSVDEEGKPVMQSVYYWEDGTKIGTSAPDRYASQFFVSTLHQMKAGERFQFVFWVKADKPATIATQAHTLPTKYKDFNTFKWVDENDLDDNGKPKEKTDFPVTTEWTKYVLGEPKGQTVPSGAGGCQTITFDTYLLQEANNYYFVFEECSFSEKNVTLEDRTLGTPEDIMLAVTNDDQVDLATTIDAAPMLAAFEVEDFSFLKNGKDGFALYTEIEPEDEGDEPTPAFGDVTTWTDDAFVDAQGFYDADGNGVGIHFDDESIDGSKINLVTWVNPESGLTFAKGETVKTKLAVSQSGWYYVYNVTLGSQETLDELAGIKAVKKDKAGNGLIYNLSGQRVDSSYKGLVIKNGQKAIQK